MVAANTANAHRVWVETNHIHDNETLEADLGYGEFPELEVIPEKRLHFFKEGMKLISKDGTQNLVQKGDKNYHFESEKPLKEGTYLITAEYSPTFWSKNKDGWKQTNIEGMPDAIHCEETRMYGKNINNVGHESAEVEVLQKPLGHLLELVPLDNPENAVLGEPFPVKVLYRGEPLPNATVTATFKGFDKSDRKATHKVEAQAFSDTTNAEGVVGVIPLRQGFWKVSVEHKVDYKDQKICHKESTYSTLTFQLGHSH